MPFSIFISEVRRVPAVAQRSADQLHSGSPPEGEDGLRSMKDFLLIVPICRVYLDTKGLHCLICLALFQSPFISIGFAYFCLLIRIPDVSKRRV